MRKSFGGPALALAMALVGSSLALAVKFTSVKVKTPGSLATAVEKAAKGKVPVALKISGALNNDDISALRALCGRDTAMNVTSGTVRELDLSEVSFAEGGAPFSPMHQVYNRPYVTSAHSLPELFLYGCNVERIVLPERLDTVGAWALAGIPVRELYFKNGTIVRPRAIALDSLLTDLRLPFTDELYRCADEGLSSLKRVETNGFYVSGGSPFYELKNLEEATFNGHMGHINATPFIRNPRLKRVVVNGPILSTGTCLVAHCDSLTEVVFNGPIGIFGFTNADSVECPLLKEYTFNAPVVRTQIEGIPSLSDEEFRAWPGREKMIRQAANMARNSLAAARTNQQAIGWYPQSAVHMVSVLADSTEVPRYLPEMGEILAEAANFDVNKSSLQILRESASYDSDANDTIVWRYDAPSDTLLTRLRERFNLDSIAGNGDDLSRIRNLMYWVHDTIRHNGSRYLPAIPFDLDNIIDFAATTDEYGQTGANCRMMAIALSQALLAEGIPARYLTCQSKNFANDPDCHVICVAWSDSLGKWIWADPTFAAFVYDENGTPLHPGEVRSRLIEGKEIVLNEDANWNHEEPQTKEHYLEEYMAKNLYIMSAADRQGARVEGPEAFQDAVMYTLVPVGFKYYNGRRQRSTSDEATFWSAPR